MRLTRSVPFRDYKQVFAKSATVSAPSFVVFLFLYHLHIIHKYAVNILFWDDWTMFRGSHPATVSIPWLFDSSFMQATATEHITATTKLFVWMQFQLNGWNNPVNLVLNFIIYGLFVCWIVWFARQAVPTLSAYMKWAFVIFLLSPINYRNHFFATQSCYHFYLIFFFLGAYALFRKEQRWIHVLAGCAFSILSLFSLAAGFGSSSVLLIGFCAFKTARVYSRDTTAHRVREVLQLAIAVLLIGGALSLWFAHYETLSQGIVIFPNDSRFWSFFLNLVSFGFGIDRMSSTFGVVCLLIVVVPICAAVWKRKLATTHWAGFVMVAGILVNAAEIAVGRAGYGPFLGPRAMFAGPKAIRYVEFVLPLIPLSMINWAVLLQHRTKQQALALAGLFLFCIFTFSNNWSFDPYRTEAAYRTDGRLCVKAYYKGVGDGRCPTIYSDNADYIPLSTWLENAREEQASFYADIKAEIEKEK